MTGRRSESSSSADGSTWATRRRGTFGSQQTVWVAIITGVATIIVALIGLLKPSHEPGPESGVANTPASASKNTPHASESAPYTPTDTPPEPRIIDTSTNKTADAHFILVRGALDTLVRGKRLALFATAAPRNGEPVSNTSGIVQYWYVSKPVALQPSGSWEARIDIALTEQRPLDVRALMVPVCDPPGQQSFCNAIDITATAPITSAKVSNTLKHGQPYGYTLDQRRIFLLPDGSTLSLEVSRDRTPTVVLPR